jgi:hypothetical protein
MAEQVISAALERGAAKPAAVSAIATLQQP